MRRKRVLQNFVDDSFWVVVELLQADLQCTISMYSSKKKKIFFFFWGGGGGGGGGGREGISCFALNHQKKSPMKISYSNALWCTNLHLYESFFQMRKEILDLTDQRVENAFIIDGGCLGRWSG